MSENSIAKISFNKNLLLIHCAILLFMFGFPFLPPIGQITPLGMWLLGIFIGALIGWCTIGFVFTCIAALLAFGFSPAFPSFTAMLASTFGFNIAVMMLACLFICAFVEVVELPHVVIGYMLNLKVARKSKIIFMMLFLTTCYFVSALSNSSLSAYLFVDLYLALASKVGIPDKCRLNSYMFLGIIFSSILGEIAFPFKPVAVLIIGLCESTTGLTLSFFDYLIYLTTFQLILLFLFVLIGKYVLQINFDDVAKIEVPRLSANIRQKLGLWCIAIMFLAFVLSSINIPFFTHLGLAGVSLLMVLLMLFVQVDNKPVLNLQELASHFGWGMYLLTVFIIPFSGFFGRPEAGITSTMKDLLGPFLTTLPPFAFVAIAICLTVCITNFMVNMPVAVIFISLMASLQGTLMGINYTAACICIATGAFISMATPAANTAAVYVFDFRDVINLPKTMIMGGIISLILCIGIIIGYYPFLSAFIG